MTLQVLSLVGGDHRPTRTSPTWEDDPLAKRERVYIFIRGIQISGIQFRQPPVLSDRINFLS